MVDALGRTHRAVFRRSFPSALRRRHDDSGILFAHTVCSQHRGDEEIESLKTNPRQQAKIIQLAFLRRVQGTLHSIFHNLFYE
jgi:hypothetical protein